ncbi:MAG TPA: hypothetical protein VN811_08455 [Thermoanaerobaculia bacterium]|nr:hypothetical protein [Thermoanaerobaculia bacterium]
MTWAPRRSAIRLHGLRGRGLPAAFFVACALAAVAPLVPQRSAAADAGEFPGWPSSFDGRPLHERPLLPREQRFASGFPGRIATFDDGRRTYVVRWVTRATRRLHPAADCFRGAGYSIEARPLLRDAEGRAWSSFDAVRGATRLRVRERVVDAATGTEFTDASSWYWAALLGRSQGPWWAWTVVENDAARSPSKPTPATLTHGLGRIRHAGRAQLAVNSSSINTVA